MKEKRTTFFIEAEKIQVFLVGEGCEKRVIDCVDKRGRRHHHQHHHE